MDAEAAGFVLDRVDVARMAITEARQVIEKFSDSEDTEVVRLLDEMLARAERLDYVMRGATYPS